MLGVHPSVYPICIFTVTRAMKQQRTFRPDSKEAQILGLMTIQFTS